MMYDFDERRFLEYPEFVSKHLGALGDYCELMIEQGVPAFLFGICGSGKSPIINALDKSGRFSGDVRESYSFYGSRKIKRFEKVMINRAKKYMASGKLVIISIPDPKLVMEIQNLGYEVFMLHGLNR